MELVGNTPLAAFITRGDFDNMEGCIEQGRPEGKTVTRVAITKGTCYPTTLRAMTYTSSRHAPDVLRKAFAGAITRGWEGFVLKGCEDPVFSLHGGNQHTKVKKDYVPGLGDTADFAIIGGRRKAKDEQELGVGKLSWTTFYTGCLENKDGIKRADQSWL